MVRESEPLARVLAEWASGGPLAADLQLRTRDQAYSDVQPPEYRADLVLELVRDGQEKPTSMMILEVQLDRDADKRRTWPAYQAVLRAQYGCPTMVVVLAPDQGVARWCAQPIDLDGHGNSVMRPTVIGPDLVPVITDREAAERLPALSVLSVIAHGRSKHALDVGRAGLHAAGSVDGPERVLYNDIVLHYLDAAARTALEPMAINLKQPYEPLSDFYRKQFAEERARIRREVENEVKLEVENEAKLEGKLETLSAVLEARGFRLDEALRTRLQSYDAAELDALVVRATQVDDIDDLLQA